MNGINGGQVPAVGGVLPSQAGHQAELNYVYSMVEELSRQLNENKLVTERFVAAIGRIRNRARAKSLSNDELIASATEDIQKEDANLDMLVSALSEAIDKAKYSRDANAALLTQYATAMSTMLKQFHDYKARHVADVSTWHRSYREQLAEARSENSRLREQIWDMQQHAGRANELLREFRARHDGGNSDSGSGGLEDSDIGDRSKNSTGTDGAHDGVDGHDAARFRWESRVRAHALRQELRFWKRMAMPQMDDDDPYWSGDDDLVDPVEKVRLIRREIEQKRKEAEMAAAATSASDAESNDSGEGASGTVSKLMADEGPDADHISTEEVIADGGAAGSKMGFVSRFMGKSGAQELQEMRQSLMGGVAMQRDNKGGVMPTPPPRPPSAGSTGSSGQ